MTVYQGQSVAMVCHRGATRLAPENTLASARAAFDLGAAYVELDVRQSRDGELVVIHDDLVDRTTNGMGAVAEKPMAEIARLDAGSWFDADFAGERVPKLADMLALAKGRGGLYIEIKDADAAAVVAITQNHDMLADSFFWSDERAILQQLRDHGESVSLMIRHTDYDDLDEAIAHFRPAVLEYEPGDVSADEMRRCHQHGVRPMVFYPGRDVVVFRQLAAAGIVLFNLDEPETFKSALKPRI